jgi:predicted dehydrogenase
MGGHYMFDDDQETPNVLTAVFEFDEGPPKKELVFEVRHWATNHEAGIGGDRPSGGTVGTIFYGSKGYLSVDNEDTHNYRSWTGNGNQMAVGPASSDADAVNPDAHWANFIDCVRSRKASDLHAPIQEGAISTTLVHLANISHRLGRSVRFDEATYSCVGDAEANRMFKRDYRQPFVVPDKV